MTDLLIVARGRPGIVASTRYRVHQYLPYLAQAGVRFDVVFPPRRKHVHGVVWPFFFSRILFLGARAQTVFVQKDIHLLALWRLLKRMRKRLVYDFDDAIYLEGPRGERNVHCFSWPQRPARDLVAQMIRMADFVLVANSYLLAFARQFNHQVEILPMAVDCDLFPPCQRSHRQPVTIGWIGSPHTVGYLSAIEPALQRLQATQRTAIHLKIVTSGRVPLNNVQFEQHRWDAAAELEHLKSFDIGVVPLPAQEPFAAGKSSYKLLQFLASGLPVVCSPVGSNVDIIEHGKNGFFASDIEEWVQHLDQLIRNAALRSIVGANACASARAQFSLQALWPRFLGFVAPANAARSRAPAIRV